MITEKKVIEIVRTVNPDQLHVWVREQWVRPALGEAEPVYNEADVARVRLLDMLDNQLEVGREAIPVILSLIDQIHDMRAQMQVLSGVIEEQPEDVRMQVLQLALERCK